LIFSFFFSPAAAVFNSSLPFFAHAAVGLPPARSSIFGGSVLSSGVAGGDKSVPSVVIIPGSQSQKWSFDTLHDEQRHDDQRFHDLTSTAAQVPICLFFFHSLLINKIRWQRKRSEKKSLLNL